MAVSFGTAITTERQGYPGVLTVDSPDWEVFYPEDEPMAFVNDQEVYAIWSPARAQSGLIVHDLDVLAEAIELALLAYPERMAKFPCGSFL